MSAKKRNLVLSAISVVAGIVLLVASSDFGNLTVIQALHDWGPFVLIWIGTYLYASSR